eukprot:985302-Prymnesium_polylepis.1
MFHQVLLGVCVQLEDSAMELAHLFSLHERGGHDPVGAVSFNDRRLAVRVVEHLDRSRFAKRLPAACIVCLIRPLDEHLGSEQCLLRLILRTVVLPGQFESTAGAEPPGRSAVARRIDLHRRQRVARACRTAVAQGGPVNVDMRASGELSFLQ